MSSTPVYVCLCAALATTAWCRLVHSTRDTPEAVRLGFVLLTVAATAAAVAPWAWQWQWLGGAYPKWRGVSWPTTALIGSVLIVQFATARFWVKAKQ